jgi:flagellar hook-basal body complex protein FliE
MGKAPPSVSSLLTQFKQLSAETNAETSAETNADDANRGFSQVMSNATEFVNTQLKVSILDRAPLFSQAL